MIAPIDDDPDSACDFDEPEPGPSWFDCPMLPRGDMLAIIERKKDLDGRAINLFRSAEMAIEPVLGNGMRSFTNVSR